MRGLSFRWRDDACRQTSVCGRRVAAVTIVIGIAVAAPVVIEAVTPTWHDTETAAKTPVIETSVAFESSLATEIAVPPRKMRTRKPTAKSAAYFGATEMAATETATTEMAATEAATEMAATEAATVTSAATKTAPVTSATTTAPVRKASTVNPPVRAAIVAKTIMVLRNIVRTPSDATASIRLTKKL
jgi:hypothetical protein